MLSKNHCEHSNCRIEWQEGCLTTLVMIALSFELTCKDVHLQAPFELPLRPTSQTSTLTLPSHMYRYRLFCSPSLTGGERWLSGIWRDGSRIYIPFIVPFLWSTQRKLVGFPFNRTTGSAEISMLGEALKSCGCSPYAGGLLTWLHGQHLPQW